MKKLTEAAIVLLVSSVFIIGCPDDKWTNSTVTSPLVGTWTGTGEGTFDVTGVTLNFDEYGNFQLADAGGTYSTDDSITPLVSISSSMRRE
jgi:hypothetical protein